MALAAGAVGYLLKSADVDEVADAILAVARGEVHLDAEAAKYLTEEQAGLRALTPRELEVLGLLAEGCSNQEIARRLAITERTARTHVSNLLGKLHLGSRTQAALLAQQEGLHPPDRSCRRGLIPGPRGGYSLPRVPSEFLTSRQVAVADRDSFGLSLLARLAGHRPRRSVDLGSLVTPGRHSRSNTFPRWRSGPGHAGHFSLPFKTRAP
jgi:DNA-binding CsgD family transcriptional regulator